MFVIWRKKKAKQSRFDSSGLLASTRPSMTVTNPAYDATGFSPTEGFRNSSLDEGKGYSEPTILEPKYSEPYSVNSAAIDSETVA